MNFSTALMLLHMNFKFLNFYFFFIFENMKFVAPSYKHIS